MKFLFDLDETLYTGDLVKVASDQLVNEHLITTKYSGRDIESFPDMKGIPDIVKERTIDLFTNPYWAAIAKKPLPGAFAMLKLLVNQGHEIAILTARPCTIHEATRFALWRDFPGIKIHSMFANDASNCETVSKINYLANYRPDVYFDDHYTYCMEALEATQSKMNPRTQVYLISNGHTPWNHNAKIKRRLTKVKSILEYDLRELVNGKQE